MWIRPTWIKVYITQGVGGMMNQVAKHAWLQQEYNLQASHIRLMVLVLCLQILMAGVHQH